MDDVDDAQERLWGMLLDYIEEGTVVPVLGRDLLSLESTDDAGNPKNVLLYRVVAEERARMLQLRDLDASALDGPNPLGTVASHYIVNRPDPNAIYSNLPGALKRVVSSDSSTGVVKLLHNG